MEEKVYQIARDEDGFYLMRYEISKNGLSTSPTKNRWKSKKEMVAAANKCKLKIVNDKEFHKILEKVML